jgi:DNA end-binding protein Ku
VEAFNARVRDEGEVGLHLLHAECHSRIRYEKTCPLHGPVPSEEIVSAYEYAKGKYVEVEPDELEAVRTDAERSLTIDSFIPPGALDPIYFDGRMYYLAPDGPEAGEPYLVFLKALLHQKRVGIGQIVFSGKEQIVQVRPYEDTLLMSMLNYSVEIRQPASVMPTLPPVREAAKKVHLAEQLIQTWSGERFDFEDYEDRNLQKLRELIEAKIEGREVVAPEPEDEPDVINLVDALRQSVARGTGKKRRESRPRPRSVAHRKPRRKSPTRSRA